MYCQKVINLNAHVATYCMRPIGHEGKCSIEINPTTIIKLSGQHAFQSWCACEKCLSFKTNAKGGLPSQK